MEASVKTKIGKIYQFISSDPNLLNMSEQVIVLLKEEKLKKKKTLNRQLNQAKGITRPLNKKKMNFPRRKIVLPKVSHNFLNITWYCMACILTTLTTH